MNFQTNFLIFAVFITGLLVNYLYFRATIIKRAKINADKFKLYAFRDELISLMTKGKLLQDEFVFQKLYKMINNSICVSEHLSFIDFVKAAQENGRDYSGRFEEEIINKDKEVKELTSAYIGTILNIMLKNSFIFRAVLQFIRLRHLSKLPQALKQSFLFIRQKEAVNVYKEYTKYQNELKYDMGTLATSI